MQDLFPVEHLMLGSDCVALLYTNQDLCSPALLIGVVNTSLSLLTRVWLLHDTGAWPSHSRTRGLRCVTFTAVLVPAAQSKQSHAWYYACMFRFGMLAIHVASYHHAQRLNNSRGHIRY